MVRHLMTLSLMGILAVASGCSMCSDSTDDAPNYQGGLYGDEDTGGGRVGSAFTSGTVVEEMVIEEEIIEAVEPTIESPVYGAGHQSSTDKAITPPVRQAALTQKDRQETAVKLIDTQGLELTDADFGIEP